MDATRRICSIIVFLGISFLLALWWHAMAPFGGSLVDRTWVVILTLFPVTLYVHLYPPSQPPPIQPNHPLWLRPARTLRPTQSSPPLQPVPVSGLITTALAAAVAAAANDGEYDYDEENKTTDAVVVNRQSIIVTPPPAPLPLPPPSIVVAPQSTSLSSPLSKTNPRTVTATRPLKLYTSS